MLPTIRTNILRRVQRSIYYLAGHQNRLSALPLSTMTTTMISSEERLWTSCRHSNPPLIAFLHLYHNEIIARIVQTWTTTVVTGKLFSLTWHWALISLTRGTNDLKALILLFRSASQVPRDSFDSPPTTRITRDPMIAPFVRRPVNPPTARISVDLTPGTNSRIAASNPPSAQTQSSSCPTALPLASQKSNNMAVLETFIEYRNLKRELERAENKNKAWEADYKALTRRMQKLEQSTFRKWIFCLQWISHSLLHSSS